MFFNSTFGFTIFGDKPMSIETIDLTVAPKDVKEIECLSKEKNNFSMYKVKEGWKVWKKYEDKVPLEGFSFIAYPRTPILGHLEIALINDENFLQTVEENLVDFQKVLEINLSSQQILDEYKKGHGIIFERIRNHDGLFGTLLGFGRNNAWEFMKATGGNNCEQFQIISQTYTDHISSPVFAAIPNTNETIKLRKKYGEQRVKIDKIYQHPDFIEKVLFQLAEVK